MKILITIIAATIILFSCKKNEQKNNSYTINQTVSKAEWKGSARDHFHVGSFTVTGTLLSNMQGKISGGDFTIPILSIEDYDLQDPIKQTLLDDLKSANFFNVALHPEATFHITDVTGYNGHDTGAVSGANYMLQGNFTMLGQTHPVSFPFKTYVTGDSLAAEAKFIFDRTKWGMNIYTDTTKPLYIYPNVEMHLYLKAAIN